MARLRTTRALAKRIELEYFKRLHPFRRWKRLLAIALPTVCALWLIILALQGDERVYTSGAMSASHAMFARDCAQCHQGKLASGAVGAQQVRMRRFWRDTSDAACVRCHDGPLHHSNQLFAPRCALCHEEHKGQMILASVGVQHCTQCHADLKTQSGIFHIVAPDGRRIAEFTEGHPEFAVVVRRGQGISRVRLNKTNELVDSAHIKLNHQIHLKPGLLGPERQPVQMKCSDCHQPDERGAYMQPITYERHCLACHLLEFDSENRFQTAERDKEAILKAYEQGQGSECISAHPDQFSIVPHDKPDMIRVFLQEKYSDYVLQYPERAGRQEVEIIRRLPRRTRYRQLPISTREWVDKQIMNAETILYGKTCKECHTLEFPADRLPVVVEPKIPARWFVQSVFDHRAHRALSCTACHQQASESRATSDVLLPGIAACQKCHNQSAGAPSRCSACHLYHDQSKARDMSGLFSIQDLAPR